MSMEKHERELILIIESDNFFRNLVVKRLRERGCQISGAADGDEGLEKIKNQKPDLIFLSLTLSRGESFEVLSRIRMDPAASSIPVIVLSNLGESEEVEEAFKSGANDFLIKVNSSPELFLKKIKENLR